MNEKALGGKSAQIEDEPEETAFDVNMDKIMQRFKVFNQVSVSNNSEEEDTTKEEDDKDKDKDKEQEEDDKKIEVQLPEINKVDSFYSDAGYWKVDGIDADLDDLLDDYE